MKEKAIAAVTLILVVGFVFVNARVIESKAEEYRKEVAALPAEGENLSEQIRTLYEDFRKDERYISLSVSHEDLTNIEEAFAEMIGAAEVADAAQFTVAKSRLEDALSHLGRLSGINTDSIF